MPGLLGPAVPTTSDNDTRRRADRASLNDPLTDSRVLSQRWDKTYGWRMREIRYKAARFEEARQPTGTEFALSVDTEAAKRAVADARREHVMAEIVAVLVVDQAVRALQDQGMTVREIATTLGISKSEVGRRANQRPAVIDYDPFTSFMGDAVQRLWSGVSVGR